MTKMFVLGSVPLKYCISNEIKSIAIAMTRWARSYVKKKISHSASSWNDLKAAKTESGGTSDPQLYAIRKYKRSEHRRIKRTRQREAKKVCFHCRMPGHGMADCPAMKADVEQGVDICFKCGSTEHLANVCTAKVKKGNEFMFAKCFVCGETGHLSRSCPDNPRGLYPDGGGCPICGSVEHFKKDCPDRPVKDDVTVYRLPPKGKHINVDDELSLYEDLKPPVRTVKKPKIVRF